MMGILENAATTILMNWVLGSWLSLLGALWRWTLEHPIAGILFWLWVFFIAFAAYSTFDRMRRAGTIAWFHWAMFAPATPAYALDIILNATLGSLAFREVPWAEDWKFWSPSWTFTARVKRHVDDPGERGRQARWWKDVLNAMVTDHV